MINRKELVKKWEADEFGKLSVKPIEDQFVKENMSQLLENQETKDIEGQDVFLTEASVSQGAINTAQMSTDSQYVGTAVGLAGDAWKFRPIALALVRRTFPDLFANKVVGVQAMSTPVGLAYALRCVYNDGNNVEAAWDSVDYYAGYTGSTPSASAALSGTGGNTSASDGWSDSSGVGASTSAAEAWQIANQYVSAGSTDWPQLKLRIDQRAIEAKTRKLAASFSLESAQDIRAMHGLDVEREMVNFLQYEITAELDRELLTRMKSAAIDTGNGGAVISAIDLTGWTGTTVNGIDGRWSGEKYMNVIASIIHQSNQIAIKTRRGPGNFVIVSPSIATCLQAAGHQFVQYTANVNPTQTMAAIGKLNGTMEVYRDQYAKTDYALIGYKGPGISDCGIIFSPYIMGLTNRAISPQDFSPRVGVMARYALTDNLLQAGRYYRLIPFYNVSKLIAGA